MNQAIVKQVGQEYQVIVNGQRYGTYSTQEKANEIAKSFKGTLAD